MDIVKNGWLKKADFDSCVSDVFEFLMNLGFCDEEIQEINCNGWCFLSNIPETFFIYHFSLKEDSLNIEIRGRTYAKRYEFYINGFEWDEKNKSWHYQAYRIEPQPETKPPEKLVYNYLFDNKIIRESL